MLDQTTKRKLDSARQILVGKVPDPKAQVEQITTALVYKFMDDMDKESEELGGEAKFFANGFSQYAWTKLLDNKLSGQERLDLYVQAITNMSKNPHIPQLFRDIFKGAFLPYNDPRTLSLFLKEINEFNYEHSENLGNAFEYLLSILGSQGDAGQFRTPRHIIDFIVEVVDPKKNETILDPACGTAGFLISAYKHILKQNKEKSLTPDEKLRLMNNLAGYDISPDMVKLALVNMYLHGFPEPKIHEYDSLTSEKRWGETFDVIMANPPFTTPKGGVSPHSRFNVSVKRTEVLFVDYIVNHLNISGRSGIVVPAGVVFKDDSGYVKIRKNLVDSNLLWAVISLPGGVFNPYSNAETSILFLDKKVAQKTSKILFVNINNDGYSLGNTRNPIKDNDLPSALELLKNYVNGKNINNNQALFVEKEDIKNNYYILVGDRYKKNGDKKTKNHLPLSKLLLRNKTPINIESNIVYKRATIKLYGKGLSIRDEEIGSKINTKKQFLIKKDQLLLSKIDARNGAFGIVPKELDGAIITGNFWAFDVNENFVNKDYLSYLLSSKKFYSICKDASSGVTNRKYLNETKFLAMEIELPKIEDQNKLITELNGYKNKIEELQKELDSRVSKEWDV
jgi:type I restriction enzyme M protein